MSYNLYEPGLYEPHNEQINIEGVSYSDHTEPIYNNDMSARIKMAYQDGYKKGYEDGKNFYNPTTTK